MVEPYLLQKGFVSRTPRGRVMTLKAYRHLGLSGPAQSAAISQIGLFDGEVGEDEDGDGQVKSGGDAKPDSSQRSNG